MMSRCIIGAVICASCTALVTSAIVNSLHHCAPPSVRHTTKEAISRCCVPADIPPGKQPVLCWEMNGRIASECCPSDTYQPASFSSVKMTYCQVKRSCNFLGVRTLREGNLTHNRQCTCDLQSSYYSVEGVDVNPDYCLYKHCRNGSVLAFNGSCVYDITHISASAVQQSESDAHSVTTPFVFMLAIYVTVGFCLVLCVLLAAIILCHRRRPPSVSTQCAYKTVPDARAAAAGDQLERPSVTSPLVHVTGSAHFSNCEFGNRNPIAGDTRPDDVCDIDIDDSCSAYTVAVDPLQ